MNRIHGECNSVFWGYVFWKPDNAFILAKAFKEGEKKYQADNSGTNIHIVLIYSVSLFDPKRLE